MTTLTREFVAKIATFVVAMLLGAVAFAAEQVTGELGSPSATTTIPGNQIPAPAPKFGGVIKEEVPGSKTWWPPKIAPSPSPAHHRIVCYTQLVTPCHHARVIGNHHLTGDHDCHRLSGV